MSTSFKGNTQSAALDNLAFSLMSRMHVILRRQNERVTDIEYMRVDPTYCRTILDLASKLPNEDLQQICLKLEEIYFGEEGLFVSPPPSEPLLNKLSAISLRAKAGEPVSSSEQRTERAGSAAADSLSLPSLEQATTIDQMYIGRLR